MDSLATDWPVIRKHWEREWTRRDKALGTVRNYCREVDLYLEWCGQEGLATSTLGAADTYVGHRECSSTHAGRNAARAIKALGKYLVSFYEDPDPFHRLVVPAEPKPTNAPTATDEDLEKLLAVCEDSWRGHRDRAIILTLALTGMRRGEIAAMREDDLDLTEGLLRIPKTKTKTPRTIYLPDPLVKALLKMRKAVAKELMGARRSFRPYSAPGVVWPSRGRDGNLTPDGISQLLKIREDEAGLSLGAHAWRRKFAGDWLRKEGTEVGLMAYAGWSSTAMVARYAKDVAQEHAIEEARRMFA